MASAKGTARRAYPRHAAATSQVFTSAETSYWVTQSTEGSQAVYVVAAKPGNFYTVLSPSEFAANWTDFFDPVAAANSASQPGTSTPGWQVSE